MRINLIFIIIIFIAAGCISGPSRREAETGTPAVSKARTAPQTGTKTEVKPPVQNPERLMVYDASIKLDIDRENDSITAKITNIASSLNGYILSYDNMNVTMRVPSESLQRAIRLIGALGKIDEKEINGEDITDEFYDMQSRLESLEKTRERYLELLKQAENVETVLKIEKELERLNSDIESYKGRLQRLSHLKEYSTINIYYNYPSSPGPLGYIFVGLYQAVKWLFVW